MIIPSGMDTIYVRVLLPLRLSWLPTYSSDGPLRVGQRVRLTFAGRSYVGVVVESGVQPSIEASRILAIDSVIEGLPDITAEELEFWKFISEYYMCPLGDVYKAAYPSLKTESELILARKVAKGKAAPAAPSQLHIRDGSLPKPEVVIGSGRLPLYENAIRRTLDSGRGALVLVCETDQGDSLAEALRVSFPGSVLPFNFKLTPARRRAVAQAIRDTSSPELIIGTRSSLFLPFRDLGLIIVDEEQDQTYKQSDSSPRYNARDLALALARIHEAAVILGSCCPSLETVLNIRNGKFVSRTLPEDECSIAVVDVGEEIRKNGMVGPFSRKCISAAGSCSSVLLVRGWEKEDELLSQAAALLPGKKVEVKTFNAARLESRFYDIVIVMQADAMSDGSDFRSDERILQLLCTLKSRCRRLVVQTSRSGHRLFESFLQNGDTLADDLLRERSDFMLPPFVRLVDIDAGIYADQFAAMLPVPCVKVGRLLRLSLPRTSSAVRVKDELVNLAQSFEKRTKGRAKIYFNVDPQ